MLELLTAGGPVLMPCALESVDGAAVAQSVAIVQGIVNIVVGVIAAGWAFWHFHLAGFRPSARVLVSMDRKQILIQLRNKGRTSGTVPCPAILGPEVDGDREKVEYVWKRKPADDALSANQLVVYLAETTKPFDEEVLVRFFWRDDNQEFSPRPKPIRW